MASATSASAGQREKFSAIDPVARSCWDGQRNQLVGCGVDEIELAAGVDQLGELRLADREAGGDRADAAGFLLEIPDEFAPGAFFREAAAAFCEHRNAWAEQRPAHCWDQAHAVHQVEHLGRVGLAWAGPVAAQ